MNLHTCAYMVHDEGAKVYSAHKSASKRTVRKTLLHAAVDA